jgi:RHS repeat-associated protein
MTSAGNGTATTSYSYDYANRLIAILYNNATTSQYGYDAFGARVYQISASTSVATTTYPFKFFSIASTTNSSNNFATSTEYAFNGDSLLATVDQAFKNGAATGTAQTSYIHPDHLGSTNVITNASGTVIFTKDYYPYGSERISSGSASLKRGYIDQFSDTSGLLYLQARYADPSRGQFLSEDSTFLALGNQDQLKQLSQQEQQEFLSDPQQLNSYSYGQDNPITRKDPTGNLSFQEAVEFAHLGKTAYDTGTFTLFPNYHQSPEELNEQAFTAISGIVTSGISYLAGGEAKYAVSGGALAVDADMAAYKYTCANIVHCQSYFNPNAHIELLSPGGPAIKIVPTQSPGSNGPAPGGSGPIGPSQQQKAPVGGQSSGSSQSYSYAQQIASLQAQIASIQAQINQIIQSRSQSRQ